MTPYTHFILQKSTNPTLTPQTGIVWFGNHTRNNSTNTKEAGVAGSFLWLLSFAEKESDALAASDTKEK